MTDDIVTAHERMFDDLCRSLDAICYHLNNNIGWLRKCMEELELKVDSTSDIIQRQQGHKTRREKQKKKLSGHLL